MILYFYSIQKIGLTNKNSNIMTANKNRNKNSERSLTNFLAFERTNLANERTFLAYCRTFIVFLSSGFVILKLEALQDIRIIGYFFLIIAPLC